jgi:hypothetical protein
MNMKQRIIALLLMMLAERAVWAQSALTGSWTADMAQGGAFYRYGVTLRNGGGCTVQVTGPAGTQETEGFWSYAGDIFKLNALFRNPAPPAGSIQWTSVLSFNGNDSFNILVPLEGGGGNLARITFFRETVSHIDDALTQCYRTLSGGIPERSRVAVVSIASGDPDEGAFLVDGLALLFVNGRRFTVVERKDIDAALGELNFQASGYVSDDSALSIGKFLGATVVITGSVGGTGARKRLVLKALDVLTAEILSMAQAAL